MTTKIQRTFIWANTDTFVEELEFELRQLNSRACKYWSNDRLLRENEIHCSHFIDIEHESQTKRHALKVFT